MARRQVLLEEARNVKSRLGQIPRDISEYVIAPYLNRQMGRIRLSENPRMHPVLNLEVGRKMTRLGVWFLWFWMTIGLSILFWAGNLNFIFGLLYLCVLYHYRGDWALFEDQFIYLRLDTEDNLVLIYPSEATCQRYTPDYQLVETRRTMVQVKYRVHRPLEVRHQPIKPFGQFGCQPLWIIANKYTRQLMVGRHCEDKDAHYSEKYLWDSWEDVKQVLVNLDNEIYVILSTGRVLILDEFLQLRRQYRIQIRGDYFYLDEVGYLICVYGHYLFIYDSQGRLISAYRHPRAIHSLILTPFGKLLVVANFRLYEYY